MKHRTMINALLRVIGLGLLVAFLAASVLIGAWAGYGV